MKKLAVLIALVSLFAPFAAAQEKPVRVAYYYKVRWGFQQEFERLVFKNHYPLLMAQKNEGSRIKAVDVYRPTYPAEGPAGWTVLGVITFANFPSRGPPRNDEA